MSQIHRLWCNCDECLRWRGRRVPDWQVAALEANLASLETRPAMPYTFDWASTFPKGSRAGLPIEWTPEDVRWLHGAGIDPWK